MNWLHTIHQYAPVNYTNSHSISAWNQWSDQMEGIDLSCWKLALNGAEPVHADTIAAIRRTCQPSLQPRARWNPAMDWRRPRTGRRRRSRPEEPSTRRVSRAALQHGEATETIDADDVQPLVSCGHGPAGEHIAIVSPTCTAKLHRAGSGKSG